MSCSESVENYQIHDNNPWESPGLNSPESMVKWGRNQTTHGTITMELRIPGDFRAPGVLSSVVTVPWVV